MNKLQIRTLLRNIRSLMEKDKKFVIVFNYHRVGPVDQDNPFHQLHTVDNKLFRQQVSFMANLGKMVSLDEIREFHNLSRVNFAITFDDVSRSVLDIKPFLKEKSVPYAICPCTEITKNGFGIRDKVYFIIKYYSHQELLNFVRKELAGRYPLQEKGFSFYRFTKSDIVDPFVIETEVITPLFNSIPRISTLFQRERAYLDWDDIKHHFLDDPLVTLVNHSEQHLNMPMIQRKDIYGDVQRSTEQFEKFLDIRPDYYAVPFGDRVTQSLALDLTDSLREKNYKGVLWVNGAMNLFENQYKSQMAHLSRIHTPPSYLGFVKTLLLSLRKIQQSIINNTENVKILKGFEPANNKIIASEDPAPALSFENLVRQGKDYASDILFYKYSFSENPYKDRRPDYYAVLAADRLESIGYNFHSRFSLSGKKVDGIYFSGWRKLPNTKSFGSALMLKAMRREPLVGIYKPSKLTAPLYKTKPWKSVFVNNYGINTHKVKTGRFPGTHFKIKEYDVYPEAIDPLSEAANQKFFFSIFRSPEFYQWRYDRYPLAMTKYFVSFSNAVPNGYFVSLYKEDILFISDFFCLSADVFSALWSSTMKFCKERRISSINIETSLPDVSKWIENTFKCRPNTFANYYYFNPKSHNIQENWESITFHETQASGDVLLK